MVNISELHIDSYVLVNGVICTVAAISKSGKVITKPVSGKKYNEPVNAGQLQPVEMTREGFLQLGFVREGTTIISNGNFVVLDGNGYSAYLQNNEGYKVPIGHVHHLHKLQMLFFAYTDKWLRLP